ncbi:hypothetical protein LJR153_007267 [Paenibacillus sp. LjRoot153]|uniref:hypothetical protein n=1 Tax=Paenibacillus sp. LjRoot153 TaxID=3342270 RepID=UPI003ECE42E6
MPILLAIIGIILLTVFFFPLISAFFIALFAVGGLLVSIMKVLFYIIIVIVPLGIAYFIFMIPSYLKQKNIRNKLIADADIKRKAGLLQYQRENGQVAGLDYRTLKAYFIEHGSYRNHPIFLALSPSQRKEMERLITEKVINRMHINK